MERKEGFYWVKYKGDWITAEWMGGTSASWLIVDKKYNPTSARYRYDSDFEQINETRIPMPDEPVIDQKIRDLSDFLDQPKIDPEAIFNEGVEAAKKAIRRTIDHGEYDIEYKSDVNGKYLDFEKIFDTSFIENPYEKD